MDTGDEEESDATKLIKWTAEENAKKEADKKIKFEVKEGGEE